MPKMWKVDTEKGEVRQVEAEPWPGKDEEGDNVFENTHFPALASADAIRALRADVNARIKFSGNRVKMAKQELDAANIQAGQDALHAAMVWSRYGA